MNQKWIKWILASFCLLSLAACNLSLGEATMDSSALGTIVAQNVQLTQMDATITAASAAKTAEPVASAQEIAATPSQTPTLQPTITPTLNGVWLTFTQNSNCRYGPGSTYRLVTTFNAYDKVQALAKSEDGLYMYVTYVDTATRYCWVQKQLAIVNGNIDRIPAITPQPTNTPTITPTSDAGFSLSYQSLDSCNDNYSVDVLLTNTGYLTWQSMKMSVTDSTTSTSVTVTSDSFDTYDSCGLSTTQDDLSTGEYAVVANFNDAFSYNPTGHSLSITVSLYSEDGLSGTVITKSTTIKP
jgi:hypothetical protein